jgi:ribonucleotide reductase alpha subunit
MSNPKAAVNTKRFENFVKEREEQFDWEDYVLPNRLDLNKKMIARDCEFDRKRITGNSEIKTKYDKIKEDLIEKGILIKDDRQPSVKNASASEGIDKSMDKRSLKKSQETHAALEEQLFQTNKDLLETKEKLKMLKGIEDYMLATGRL